MKKYVLMNKVTGKFVPTNTAENLQDAVVYSENFLKKIQLTEDQIAFEVETIKEVVPCAESDSYVIKFEGKEVYYAGYFGKVDYSKSHNSTEKLDKAKVFCIKDFVDRDVFKSTLGKCVILPVKVTKTIRIV